VPAFDIWEGSIMLRETAGFPENAVIVGVVDPGVGSERTVIALRTNAGLTYIAPNNGLLTWVARQQGIASMVELDPLRVNSAWKPGTFDGRDLFAPAAAMLASNPDALDQLGKPLDPAKLVLLEIPDVTVSDGRLEAGIERVDRPYGNALTLATIGDVKKAGIANGHQLKVTFESGTQVELPLVTTFSDVPEGQPLAYLDARGHLAFAVNLGNFMSRYNLSARDHFVVQTVADPPLSRQGTLDAPRSETENSSHE
jgi:S-adenosylmethionine hydrolase